MTVYLYHAGVPDLDEQTSDVLAVDELGITMSGIPAPNVDFYPWTAIRQVTLTPSPDAGQQQRPQRQQNPYDLEPGFPQVRF